MKKQSVFGKTWLYVIFIATALIAVVHFVGPDYFSPKAISSLEFWIGIVAVLLLIASATLDTGSLPLIILMYFASMALLAASAGNLYYHYTLSPFWQHTLNLNGIIASLLVMFLVCHLPTRPFRFFNFRFRNLYKRRNNMLDDIEMEKEIG